MAALFCAREARGLPRAKCVVDAIVFFQIERHARNVLPSSVHWKQHEQYDAPIPTAQRLQNLVVISMRFETVRWQQHDTEAGLSKLQFEIGTIVVGEGRNDNLFVHRRDEIMDDELLLRLRRPIAELAERVFTRVLLWIFPAADGIQIKVHLFEHIAVDMFQNGLRLAMRICVKSRDFSHAEPPPCFDDVIVTYHISHICPQSCAIITI